MTARIRAYPEAKTLADAGVTELATYAGGKSRRLAFENRDDGAVAARLYRTDIVTWHPDGRVVLDTGGWSTLSTFDGMAVALGIQRAFIGTRSYVPHYFGTAFRRTLTLDAAGDPVSSDVTT